MPIDLGIIDQVLFQLLLVATIAVFIGDLIANMISFENRFMNAIALAVIAAIAVIAFGMYVDGRPIGELAMPGVIVAGLAFLVGYLGNLIAFGNRFINALVTAIAFAVLSSIGFYISTLAS